MIRSLPVAPAFLALCGLALLAPAVRAAVPPELGVEASQESGAKRKGESGPNAPMSGGETVSNPTVIPSIPYTDTGGTCDAIDNYPSPCWLPSASPDVVYAYTPVVDEVITISTCSSGFDTGLFVYEGEVGTVVACNDDACGLHGYQARIVDLPVRAGFTYYIIVEGYDQSCGTYTLDVTGPCDLTPPAGALVEGEPDCANGYEDHFNGGCNSSPAVFTTLPCSDSKPIVMSGRYGTFLGPGSTPYRDTDWYEVVIEGATEIDFSVTGEAPTQIAIVDAGAGCSAPFLICETSAGPCLPAVCHGTLLPGTYYLFVATIIGAVDPCDKEYVLRLTGYPCTVPPPPPPQQGMYGSTALGQLLTISTLNGIGTFLAPLPTFRSYGCSEIEYDINTKVAYLQGTDGSFVMQKFDIDSGIPMGSLMFIGASFTGLEVIGNQLYGVGHTEVCGPSFLAIINPNNGNVTQVGPTGMGPITGLAFDDANGLLYGITGCASGNSRLVRINPATGAATILGPTGFVASSLEFGEDHQLYAGGATESSGKFYRLDRATGIGSFVGNSRFPNLTGLTLVSKSTPTIPKSWGALKVLYHR